MKHTFQKWLCLLLAMTMVIGLLPAGMFAGAASDAVVLGQNQYLVDDDFASAAANETVTAEVAGVTYQGVMGTNAFATISAAVAKAIANGEVYVAAGTYEEKVSISQNISLFGNNKDVNPNNKDWSINSKRTDPEKESTIIGLVKVTKTGLTKFVVNGFSFTGAGGIDENLSSGATKGIDVCYNYFHDNINISDSQGVWRFINPATRTGRIAYNRVENNCSAKTLTFRNADDFTIEGNYIYNTASSQGLWISAETKNGSADPGIMKMTVKNNYIITKSYAYYFSLHYAKTVDIDLTGNYGQASYGAYLFSMDGCTTTRNINIENNTFKGSTNDIRFAEVGVYDPTLVTVKNNKFLNGSYTDYWKSTGGVLDLSYNYFGNTPKVTSDIDPIVYPRYTDEEMTALQGEMLIDKVNLYGIKSNGDQETLTGVTVDNDAQTITLKDNVDAVYDAIRVEAITQTADSDITVEYYADYDMTTQLTDGDVVDYLKRGNNLVYIKLITSLDNYSYKRYALTIPREASSKADVVGVNEYEGNVSGNTVAITVPSDVKDANILLNTSLGATYRLYRDKDLTDMISGTMIYDIPAATTTYYAKVTAEDGVTTKTYTLVVTKAPVSDVSIKRFVSPAEAMLDSWESTETIPAYVANFTYDVTSTDVDIEVADGAAWDLYEDVTCAKAVAKTDIELTDEDQTYFIKVTGEKNVASQVYKLILHRDTKDNSKNITAVTSDALKATVQGNEIYISLAATVTAYKPEFEYVGSELHIYDENDDVLAGDMFESVPAGKHTYYIRVFAKDGTYKQYSLTVERKANTSAILSAIGGGSDAYVDRFDYLATTKVPNEGAFMPAFVLDTKSTGATVSVLKNGEPVELPLNLRAGTSKYTIVVTAEDGITTTEYDWTITCVGDGVEVLSGAVVLSDEWAECAEGDIVYANIDGKKYKAYYGDTAFSVYAQASAAAKTNGKTVYVMPNTMIAEDIIVNGIKLYGPNYTMNGNNSARYPESTLGGRVIVRDATVSGFTVAESGYITVPADNAVISNNIFLGEERTDTAIQADDNLVSNITINSNLFDFATESDAIHIAEAGDALLIEDNRFDNTTAGVMLAFASLSGEMEVSGNNVSGALATAVASADGTLAGYLYVHDNIVTAGRAVNVDAADAEPEFAIDFNNNNVDTSKVAVNVSKAPAALASNVTVNQNTFASIEKSVLIDFAEQNTTPVDVTENYFGTYAPAGDAFDSFYNYKPYYLNAAKTVLSNTVNMLNITVNGQEIVDDGESEFAVISSGSATVAAQFAPVAGIPAAAYGKIYIDGAEESTGTYDVTSGNVTVTVKAVSPDGTASQTRQVVLYPQSANPIYNVYDVVNSVISDMDVMVVVEHTTAVWTPKLAVVNNSAVTFYEDAACTKALNNITLDADSTVVYAKVAGYPAVTVTVYKKLSYEKAILSLKDAYTFEYTASATATATVDNRITPADLSAVVSDGAVYEVYKDAGLTTEADETLVSEDTTLYYKVTAADGTSKVFEVTVKFIEVVDPEIISIENTTTDSVTDNEIVATVNSYDASAGFTIKLNVNSGCTYVLYTDAAHSVLCKNNTTFFGSNYVYAYAVVTSPDGVVSANYTIKLVKATEKVTFMDKVPTWATAAVEYTKDLGIVNGVKVDGGVKLNADGASTRETMACLMVRMLGIDATQYAFVDLSGFEDSAEVSSWALSSVKAAVQLGLFTGAKNGDKYYLNPTDNINREQFAIVFVRAIGAGDEDVKSYSLDYKDAAAISSWARTEVKIMTKLGLMQGSYGNFNPKNNVTRAQILQVIYNYMK